MSEKGTDARAGETQLAEICVRNSTTLERGLVLLPGLPSPAAIFRDSCAGFATSESADLRSFVSSKLSGVASTRSLDTTSYQARNGSSFAISVLTNYASKTLRHSPVQDRRVRTLGMNLVSFFSNQSVPRRCYIWQRIHRESRVRCSVDRVSIDRFTRECTSIAFDEDRGNWLER